ncbi:hypothetical protein TIFTF001_028658 [Ficus carica]|uniref:Uncharacterized protein n=1 Tax=Ficus carica TaxID=3494 RepID=A0AA88DQD1_FICCA|nr:hypothetical protein TIFTF001_028658 [Ficus carica]
MTAVEKTMRLRRRREQASESGKMKVGMKEGWAHSKSSLVYRATVQLWEVRFFFVVPSPQKSLPKFAASTSGAAANLNDAVEDPENAPQAPTTPSSSYSSPPTTTSSAATSITPSPLPKTPLLFALIFSPAS